MKIFELTAKGRYYEVYKDGVFVSNHTTEREAVEKSQDILFGDPHSKVKYFHKYEVEVALTTAGLTLAGTQGGGQVDLPPTITSTPSPSFTEGTPNTYDMSAHWDDDGLSTVTSDLDNTLPNGLSYNGNTHILTYDGIGVASVSQHTLNVHDSVGSVSSNSFNISIAEAPSGLTFLPHNPTNYVPRVRGVAGFAMDSSFGTAQVGMSSVDVRIQRVTTTNDGDSTAGGERLALGVNHGVDGMVVVYDTSGWRDASSRPSAQDAFIACGVDNITVARNTAPGLGFFSRGGNVRFNGQDQLVWHFGNSYGPRPGASADAPWGDSGELSSSHGASINCAWWFGGDETFSGANCDNLTVYNTIVAHGLSQGSFGSHNFCTLFEHTHTHDFGRCGFYHGRLRNPRASSDGLTNGQPSPLHMYNSLSYNGLEYMHVLADRTSGRPYYQCYRNVGIAGPHDQNRAFCIFDHTQAGNALHADNRIMVEQNKLIGVASAFDNGIVSGGPVVQQTTVITECMAHGLNPTPVTGLSDLDAVDLIQSNLGPRPGNPLGYFASLKSQARASAGGGGDPGEWCDLTPGSVYTGGAVSGFDDIPVVTKDNFAEIAAFLSANYTQGVDYSLIDTGTNHRTYTFSVDSGTAYTPIDVWLNDVVNDSVMNSGWET